MTVLYCTDLAGDGGGHRHRVAVAGILERLGWTVTEFSGVMGFLRGARATLGGPVGRRRGPRRLAASLALLANSVLVTPLLVGRIVRSRPRVILWRPGLFQFHGLLAARLLRVPLVLEVNAPLAEEAADHGNYAFLRLAGRIERLVQGGADHAVAVSEANARRLATPANVSVVANGGGYLDPTEVEAAWAWGEKRCPVCRDSESSRFAVLLETFRSWHGDTERRVAVESLPDGWRLLVIGDGPGRADFLNWVDGRGLADRVVAVGSVPAAGVQHLLEEHADLGFVLYPALERFYFSPLKLYDFLFHRVPVIATDLGQVGDVGREAPDGLVTLVGPGDLDALAAAVGDRCSSVGGGGSRQTTAVNGSRYSWDRAVKRYSDVLVAAAR